MREIIEYNLNQLKRLYSAPLLSVHLNMIDGLDDLKIMEECILSEDDARECKSQYNNVGLGQNNIVVFPTFLFCPNRFQ